MTTEQERRGQELQQEAFQCILAGALGGILVAVSISATVVKAFL